MNRLAGIAGLTILASGLLTGCEYARLLRPKVLKQLNPRVVHLVNEFPEVDRPNKAIVGRLFAHGGASTAKEGADGKLHDRMYIPRNQYMWYPAIIVMPHGGDLELEVSNDDAIDHIAFMPSDGERQVLTLPVGQAGKVAIHLGQPGLYWFGCPIANHAGRGMLGLIIVKGDVGDEAKLDRPKQKRP